MLQPESLPALQSALGKAGLDGWLLYDFHGLNPVAVGMLELHFPPAAISDLKAGDTITVHLGYAKGDVAMGKEAGSSGMKAGGTAGKNP